MTEDSVGKFIKTARKEKGLTQKDLAEKMRVTDKAVSKWERGLAFPDITLIPKLAEIFDVSVEDIMLSDEVDLSSSSEDKQKKLILGADKISKMSLSKKLNIALGTMFVAFILMIAALIAINLITNSLFDDLFFWSAIPSVSLLIILATFATGIYAKKFKFSSAFFVASIGTIGLLFVIESITPIKGWSVQIGLPTMGIVLITIIIGAFMKSKKINNHLIGAACLFASLMINISVNQFLLPNYLSDIGQNEQTDFCVTTNLSTEKGNPFESGAKQVCIEKPNDEVQAKINIINYAILSSFTIILLFVGVNKHLKR